MANYTVSAKAIVSHPPKDSNRSWEMQEVKLREPNADELLVRMIATGICHTDLHFGILPTDYGNYPKVLGHEGAGYVEKAGSNVKGMAPGDPVLLSFASCTSCRACQLSKPGYCQNFMSLNIGAVRGIFEDISGNFFGQSSFSSMAIVGASSVVNVSGLLKDENDLKLFAPLGCGFQTGAGAVTELANANKDDLVAVFGLGGVGLLAIIAAKTRGCSTIIGVDRFASRLDLAKKLGATHTIDTLGFTNLSEDLAKAVKENTKGSGTSINIDTTGNLNIIRAGLSSLANSGQLIIIGIPPPGSELGVNLNELLQSGKSIRGCIEGNAVPSKYIPQMIQWYREGKLPINELVKLYPAQKFDQAASDMDSGVTVKPVLIW
ncbi:NAD(P)-binding protein [Glonium stellatum]|uniref:NAD(P)-binding protein n=1 Tax=Glonium stellatum TaxID=574774 RepID=A0A8E2ETX6_9PEZI|nr:NAD(P)-binding protein [Glonium stellatum]